MSRSRAPSPAETRSSRSARRSTSWSWACRTGSRDSCVGVLAGLSELPHERPSFTDTSVHVADRLPAWLPARRTIGGFYVVRSLGSGGGGSVLVVNRVEDRHDPNAERFALKVPDYNATAARSISQEQFLKLFRDEASALIMMPNHSHLARFVTFDLSARPLPILVMELIEGVTLERLVESLAFDMKRCLKALDDVLAGLEAMHELGTGHLDIKPSNVVLRRGNEAVLVDFGLSGRNIRPGCGTGPYGAPEVWGVVPDGYVAMPPAADVYSFACLAFEVLTGTVLFEAPNEVAQIAMHVAHDGEPERMRLLATNPAIRPLVEVLGGALRRDPRERPTAAELRRELAPSPAWSRRRRGRSRFPARRRRSSSSSSTPQSGEAGREPENRPLSPGQDEAGASRGRRRLRRSAVSQTFADQ